MNKVNKLKIITVVGTRPEIIRLSRVIAALDASEGIEHLLVHTGQNYDYELNEIFFNDLEIRKPDIFLNAATGSAGKTVGQILIKIEDVLEENMPDAFLVLGDTNSCLCAIAAKKRKIPVFHMEAGNRCFDARVPEETNRKIVDHISDINLTYSDIAREYLLREGIAPDRVIKTGSPMFEVLEHYKEKIQASSILETLGLKPGEFFLVSSHREENINDDKNFNLLIDSLSTIANQYHLPVIVSTHPRTRIKIDENKVQLHPKIQLLKPLGYFDYNFLQMNAKAVLSDSGTISEESSIMKFPALNIREAHERPEAMEQAAVMMTGLHSNRILQGLVILEQEKRKLISVKNVSDYMMPDVSAKVVRIIVSYIDYVNRVVWRKDK